MVTREQMVEAFGSDSLRRLSAKALETVRIPESSKRVLQEIGLPGEVEDLMLTFDFDPGHLPTLGEYAASQGHQAPEHASGLLRIGTDFGTQICLDEKKGGALVTIDIKGRNIPDRFMNSSVEHLAAFLVVYQKYRGSALGKGDEEVREKALEERRELKRIDPEALVPGDEHWWGLIMEQMEYGEL